MKTMSPSNGKAPLRSSAATPPPRPSACGLPLRLPRMAPACWAALSVGAGVSVRRAARRLRLCESLSLGEKRLWPWWNSKDSAFCWRPLPSTSPCCRPWGGCDPRRTPPAEGRVKRLGSGYLPSGSRPGSGGAACACCCGAFSSVACRAAAAARPRRRAFPSRSPGFSHARRFHLLDHRGA